MSWFVIFLSWIVTKKNMIHDKKITNRDFFSSLGMALTNLASTPTSTTTTQTGRGRGQKRIHTPPASRLPFTANQPTRREQEDTSPSRLFLWPAIPDSIGPLLRNLKSDVGLTSVFWESEKGVEFLHNTIDGESKLRVCRVIRTHDVPQKNKYTPIFTRHIRSWLLLCRYGYIIF